MIYYSQIIMRWLWLPVLLSLIVAVIRIPYYRRQKFFSDISLRGYDKKIPRYLDKRNINKYLRRLRFKATIPLSEWEDKKPSIELFYKKRIYKMEQPEKNLRVTDVYLIQERLPSFIQWEDSFMEPGDKFSIGESYTGKIIWDTLLFPHGLCAGATSSGKTNILRCIIHQAICKKWNVQVFDFKNGGDFVGVEQEAQQYSDLKEGYGSFIITDPEEARQILAALIVEVDDRAATFKKAGVSNITEYNAKIGFFTPWLVVIDEAAEILDVRPRDKAEKELYAEIDHSLRTLARKSRSAGIHILMGLIRPDATVLDGQTKNNLLWRACGYFADPAASRIVLDNDKATALPPEIKGRFIIGEEETQAYYMPIPEPEPREKAGPGGEAEREQPGRSDAGGGGLT